MCYMPLLGQELLVIFEAFFLEINILSPLPCVAFTGNIPLLKAFRVNSRLSQRAYALS